MNRKPTQILQVVVALLLVAMPASPARAFDQARFPILDHGSSGIDVLALQYFLRERGFEVSPDGTFGWVMHRAVKEIQGKAGLKPTGVVGSRTWRLLIHTARKGNQGAAVRAVQEQLNAKRFWNLAADGSFGSKTEYAVRSFQNHAGIEVTGVVDRSTWRNLLWHFRLVPAGRQLCPRTEERWGTGATAGQLTRAAKLFRKSGNGRVSLGHVSLEHGGYFPPHISHRIGMDADIIPIRKDNDQCTEGTTWQSDSYDRRATRKLIRSIYEESRGHVKVIWFNDPRLAEEGLVERLENHDDHLHVRWCVARNRDPNYEC